MSEEYQIIIAEDNPADVFLVQTSLEQAKLRVCLNTCSDGAEALDLIARIDGGALPPPDLLLLDLNLPKFSGEEILAHFRRSAKCASSPVIVITSSDSPRDRERAVALGARYFRKPADLDEFLKLGELVRVMLTEITATQSEVG